MLAFQRTATPGISVRSVLARLKTYASAMTGHKTEPENGYSAAHCQVTATPYPFPHQGSSKDERAILS